MKIKRLTVPILVSDNDEMEAEVEIPGEWRVLTTHYKENTSSIITWCSGWLTLILEKVEAGEGEA